MSTIRAKEVISEFLAGAQSDALVLKGRWGTGKTFSWDQTVKRLASSQKLGKPKYAYVSLFGINSLEQLKDAIFEQTLTTATIPQGASLETFRKNIKEIFAEPEVSTDNPVFKQRLKNWLRSTSAVLNSQTRKALPYAGRIPFLSDYLSFVRSASFLFVRDTIVCFDDFERKGQHLLSKEIFGLTTMLKEQRKCKIAIILNDEYLKNTEAEDYRKYREKVVDIEINFRPSPQECADLVFNSGSLGDAKAQEKATKLNIQNIRILQRIKRFIDGLMKELEGYEKEVLYSVINSLVLFTWSVYSGEDDAPPLEYILNDTSRHFSLASKDNDNDEHKKWNAIIRSYRYLKTDELDLELAKYIKSGFFIKDSLKEKLEAKNAEILAYKAGGSYAETWLLFHDTFQDNETELVDTMSSRLRKHAKHLNSKDLNASVTLFRELGHNSLADELIEAYIEANRSQPKIFALDSYPFRGDITDKRINERFSEVYAELEEKKSLADVVKDICFKNGCNPKDEKILSEATEEEYYNFFKSEVSSDLVAYVDTCLRFGKFSNPSKRHKIIAENATNALIRISRESKLNEIRVQRLGIHLTSTMDK